LKITNHEGLDTATLPL